MVNSRSTAKSPTSKRKQKDNEVTTLVISNLFALAPALIGLFTSMIEARPKDEKKIPSSTVKPL